MPRGELLPWQPHPAEALDRQERLQQRLFDQAERTAAKSKEARTLSAYASDWADFVRWCQAAGFEPLPATPQVIAAYLSDPWRVDATLGDIVELRAATMERRLSAIALRHAAAGFDPPPTRTALVRAALEGLYRGQRDRPELRRRPAKPIELNLLRAMVATCDRDSLLGLRDRALLVVGWAGAFRRSELVGLDLADLQDDREGLRITLRVSKTDQRGLGHEMGLPYGSHEPTCPVRAVRDWVQAARLEGQGGPLFRSLNRHGRLGAQRARQLDADQLARLDAPDGDDDGSGRGLWAVAAEVQRLDATAVTAVVKKRVLLAGEEAAGYSAHSLRAGWITTAARRRVPQWLIMQHTRHTSDAIVRGYIRLASVWDENPAAMVGL